jgi:hypothetical protein
MSKKILYYQHDVGIGRMLYIYKTKIGTIKLSETRDKTDIADILWQAKSNSKIIALESESNIKKLRARLDNSRKT